ncbi:MAG: tetratricopeptide repeat protein [Elusimicrobiota bacterium]
MIYREILEYVQRHYGRFSEEQIRGALLKAGVPRKGIDQALREAGAARRPPAPPEPAKRGGPVKWVLPACALLLLGGGFFAVRHLGGLLESPEFQARLKSLAGGPQAGAGKRVPGARQETTAPAGGNFQTYITLAWKAHNRGDTGEAVRFATQALQEPVPEANASDAKKAALGIRARSYELSKRYEEALADYRALAGLDPKATDGHYGIARIYLAMKDYSRAATEAGKMIAAAPDHAEGHALQAAAYSNMARPKRAIEKFSKAILLAEREGLDKKQPAQLANWHFNRGVLEVNRGRVSKGMRDVSRAVELAPKEAYYRTVRARLYESTGKRLKAREDHEAARGLDPGPGSRASEPDLGLGPTLPALGRP